MKKILLIILLGALFMLITGENCDNKEKNPPPAKDESTNRDSARKEPPDDPYRNIPKEDPDKPKPSL